MKRTLLAPIIILLTLSILSFVIYAIPSEKFQWASDISLNLGTEILGILLTVLLIDLALKRHSENERKKYQEVAFQQLRIPITRFLQLLFNIYKASTKTKPQKTINSLDDFFSNDYFIQISELDFSKPAPTAAPVDWFDFLARESTNFKETLSRSLEKYSIYLPPETVELFEQVINSHLISFLQQTPAVKIIDQQKGFKRKYNFFSGDGMESLLKEDIDSFKKLVSSYNTHCTERNKIHIFDQWWRNDISPKIGSSRIDE